MGLYAYNLLTFLLVILFVLGFVSIVMWFKKKEGERKTKVLLSAVSLLDCRQDVFLLAWSCFVLTTETLKFALATMAGALFL